MNFPVYLEWVKFLMQKILFWLSECTRILIRPFSSLYVVLKNHNMAERYKLISLLRKLSVIHYMVDLTVMSCQNRTLSHVYVAGR